MEKYGWTIIQLLFVKSILDSNLISAMPLLSIIIPVYKTERYLSDCLKSLDGLSHFKNETEVIVVSDASPNNPETIVQDFTGVLNIRCLVHQKNSSVFQARKTGILASQGEYILSLDSDDTLLSMRWKELLSYLDRSKTDILRFSEAREKKDIFNVENKSIEGQEVWDYFVSKRLWQLAGTAIRRNLFIKLFDRIELKENSAYINMADDLCYSAGLFNIAKTFSSKAGLGHYCYRLNPTSLTRSSLGDTLSNARRLARDYSNCKQLGFCFLEEKRRKTDFQTLLDSNLPWIAPKLCNVFTSFPEIWDDFCNTFSPIPLFHEILHFDITSSAAVLSHILKKKKGFEPIKRIGIVVTKLQGGGTERMACSLASILSNYYHIHLITSFESENDYPVASSVNVKCIAEGQDRRLEILKFCCGEGINTLIFVDYYLEKTLRDILYFKFHGLNVIAQEHNSFAVPFYTGQIALMAERTAVYKLTNLLTCLSQSDLMFWQSLGVSQAIYMPNILTLDPKYKNKKLSSGVKNVLFLGRLTPLKGSEDLIPIILNTCNQRNDIVFEICGSFTNPQDEANFKSKLKELIIAGKVNLLGQIQNVEEKISGATVLILPSYVEGSPMVIGEARSMGTPTIMYSLPYVDIANEGVISTPVGQPLLFSETLLSLIDNPSFYEELSSSCYKGIEKWSSGNVSKLWHDALSNLPFINHDSQLEPAVCELSRQIQLAVNYIYYNDINLKEDKDLQKKINRYNKMMNLFSKFFPNGSKRRRFVKIVIARSLRLLDNKKS